MTFLRREPRPPSVGHGPVPRAGQTASSDRSVGGRLVDAAWTVRYWAADLPRPARIAGAMVGAAAVAVVALTATGVVGFGSDSGSLAPAAQTVAADEPSQDVTAAEPVAESLAGLGPRVGVPAHDDPKCEQAAEQVEALTVGRGAAAAPPDVLNTVSEQAAVAGRFCDAARAADLNRKFLIPFYDGS